MIAVAWVTGVILYGFMITFSLQLFKKWSSNMHRENEEVCMFFGSILWPIGLPMWYGGHLGKKVKNRR